MDQQHVHQLAEQFIEALHNLEHGSEEQADAMAQLFSDNAHLTNAALKLSGQERTGRDEVRAFWTEYRRTFGEVHTEFFQVTVNETAAGLFWTTKGTDGEGNPIEYDGTTLLVFGEDDQIVQFRGYYDTREMSRKVSA